MTIHHWPTPTISTNQTTPGHQNRLVVFLISGQGYFTFLYQQTKYNREDERKEEQNQGLGLAPGARKEKSVILLCSSPWIYRLLRVCIRAKLPLATRNADSSSRVGQPGICRSTSPSSRLSDFCWMVSSLPDSHLLTDLLLTALSCRLSLGHSVPCPLPVSWVISHASHLCGFRTKTKGLSDWHPHSQKRMPPFVSHNTQT